MLCNEKKTAHTCVTYNAAPNFRMAMSWTPASEAGLQVSPPPYIFPAFIIAYSSVFTAISMTILNNSTVDIRLSDSPYFYMFQGYAYCANSANLSFRMVIVIVISRAHSLHLYFFIFTGRLKSPT